MLKVRKLRMSIAAVLCMLTIFAVSVQAQATKAAQPQFVLKAQGTGSLGGAWDPLYVGFGQKVEQRSNGRVKVQFYPGQTFAPDREYLEMMIAGTADVFMGSNSTMGLIDPKWDILSLPYAIPNRETLYKLLEGDLGKALAASIQKQGLRVLAWAESSPREFHNTKREIRKPSDLKGLKIRSPENRPTEEWMRSIGADPVVLSMPEMMPALQQGVVDGADFGIVTIKMMNFQQVTKYWTLDRHLFFTIPVMISEITWKKLPADLQKIVQDAAVEAAREQRATIANSENDMIAFAEKNGVKVTRLTPAELKVFQDTAKPIYPKFAKEIGEDMYDILFGSQGINWR